MTISKKLIDEFLDLAVLKLSGDWVILGGAVPYLLGATDRPTSDIDLAGPVNSTQRDTLALMEIAESLGMPIESVNQSAAFFLHRIAGWQDKLLLIRHQGSCRILMPNTELFFQLKIQRSNEADIVDLKAVWRLEKSKAQIKHLVLEICENALLKKEVPAHQRILKLIEHLKNE